MSHTTHGTAPQAGLLRNQSHNLKIRPSSLWFCLQPAAPENSPRAAIFSRDNYRCAYCCRLLTDCGDTEATIDHIIPQCRFEIRAVANQDVNRVACCWQCNQTKRDWTPRTPTHRAWYDRTYCLKFIAALIRSQCRATNDPGPLPVNSGRP